jgi:sugar phosphate isomerase/epimerase
MSDLAAQLSAPGIRVFGDTIRAGADREATRGWIADSVRQLGEIAAPKGVGVWIETHGDFASASETAAILKQAWVANAGVVWDPINSYVAYQEHPAEGAAVLGAAIRHVHIKDVRRKPASPDQWDYVVTGEGEFPLQELQSALKELTYDGFLSFEWEKKWHPELAEAEIALPHFAKWFRTNYAHG